MAEGMKRGIVRLLRASERYTKTDMLYLGTGGFWMIVGQAISSLSAFALAVAFGNLLPQEAYGTYKYILSIAGIFAIFTLPGMATSFSRATAQGKSGAIRAATLRRIQWSVAGAVIALAGSAYYFLHHNVELSLALLIIAATLPFFDTFTLYVSYFAGMRRFDVQAKLYALTQSVSVISLIATAALTRSLIPILLAYFVPLSILRFTLYRRTLRLIPKEKDEAAEKETLAYGWHLTAMSILGTVAGNIDKILLWQFLGPVQVAVYTFAIAMPEQLKGPLKGVSDLAFPKFAKQTPEEVRANLPALWRKLALYGLGLLIIAGIYWFAAPFIYRILFPRYLESVFYSQIFMLSAIGLVGTIPLAVLGAHKRIKEQYVFFTSQPVLQIVLYALLIPLWGVMGAIVARIIMRVLYIIQSVIMLNNSFAEDRGSQ